MSLLNSTELIPIDDKQNSLELWRKERKVILLKKKNQSNNTHTSCTDATEIKPKVELIKHTQSPSISQCDIKQKEDGKDTPFYVQLSQLIVRDGKIRFMGNADDKKPTVVHLSEGKWSIISDRELKKKIKNPRSRAPGY
jgi:hypothetical protein